MYEASRSAKITLDIIAVSLSSVSFILKIANKAPYAECHYADSRGTSITLGLQMHPTDPGATDKCRMEGSQILNLDL
jgi:hypothetical protein